MLHLPGLLEFIFCFYLSVTMTLLRENCVLGNADVNVAVCAKIIACVAFKHCLKWPELHTSRILAIL